jgi:hypothetical protein
MRVCVCRFGFIDDGWGLQLARAYSRKADVINRGFGGCAVCSCALFNPCTSSAASCSRQLWKALCIDAADQVAKWLPTQVVPVLTVL